MQKLAGVLVGVNAVAPQTTGIIRCDQPRALDLAARDGRQVEQVPDAVMAEVLAKLLTLLQ